jgi:hypothetical protein
VQETHEKSGSHIPSIFRFGRCTFTSNLSLSHIMNISLSHIMNIFGDILTARIPPEFGRLKTLRYLQLGNNHLSSSIQVEVIANLSKLVSMDLHFNMQRDSCTIVFLWDYWDQQSGCLIAALWYSFGT